MHQHPGRQPQVAQEGHCAQVRAAQDVGVCDGCGLKHHPVMETGRRTLWSTGSRRVEGLVHHSQQEEPPLK